MADFQLNVVLNGAQQTVSTIAEIEAALRQTRAELKNVEVGSEAFDTLSAQAQKLQFQFKENFKEATNFYQSLGDLGESVGRLGATITSGFTIATSAVALFGGESEAVTKAAEKAQAGLALAYSFTTIATNAKRLSEDLANVATSLGINLTRTKTAVNELDTAATIGNTVAEGANTTATIANTAATGAQTVATKGATIAQQAMNVAMKATPIGLLIAGLTALVVYWDDIFESVSNAEQAVLDYSEAQRKVNDDLEQKTFKTIGEGVTKYNELQNAIEGASDAGSKQTWIKEALKDLPELSALTGEEADAAKKVTDALQVRANLVEYEARRAEIIEKIANQEAKIVEYNRNYAKGSKEQQETLAAQSDEALRLVQYYRTLLPDIESSISSQKQFQNEIIKANKELEAQKKAEEDAAAEAKRKAEERKRAFEKAYADIKKQVQDTLKELAKIEKDYDLEVQKAKFTTKEEEVQFELDQEKAKIEEIKTTSLKEVEDARKKGILKKGEFEKANADIIAAEKKAQDELVLVGQERLKVAIEEDNKVKQERLRNIEEIKLANQVLNEEISFGDQNTADNKIVYALNSAKLQIEQLELLASLNQEDRKQFIAGLTEEEQAQFSSFTTRLFDYKEYLKKKEELIKQQFDVEEKLAIADAEAQGRRIVEENKKNLKERFAVEIEEVKNGTKTEYKIKGNVTKEEEAIIQENLRKQQANATEQTEKEKERIQGEYRIKRKDNEKKTEDEILAYKISQVQKYTDLAAQIANAVLSTISAFNEVAKVNSENFLREQRDATAQQTNDLNIEYNNQRALLDEKLAAGIISQQEYNNTITDLDKALVNSTDALNQAYRDKELAEKKKAFESDKKLKTAQAIISGIQGAVSAFTGAFQLGPIAGPIVGGVLAALVAATTAAQVAAIQKTKFDSGAPEITPPNTGGGAASTGGAALNQVATGGFTGFSPTLTGTTGGGGGTTTEGGFVAGAQRVYVLESDITNSQRRVSTLESNATFG